MCVYKHKYMYAIDHHREVSEQDISPWLCDKKHKRTCIHTYGRTPKYHGKDYIKEHK